MNSLLALSSVILGLILQVKVRVDLLFLDQAEEIIPLMVIRKDFTRPSLRNLLHFALERFRLNFLKFTVFNFKYFNSSWPTPSGYRSDISRLTNLFNLRMIHFAVLKLNGSTFDSTILISRLLVQAIMDEDSSTRTTRSSNFFHVLE
jgi:hypothetical protein